MKRRLPTLALLGLLAGCAGLPQVGPDYRPAPLPLPAAWQAPLPHGGELGRLSDWWRQLDDPLLLQLIEAAQAHSASLAEARARIVSARAAAVGTGAAGLPSLDASLAAKRAAFTFGGPTIFQTTRQASLMANWEIDLFGGIARDQEGAAARLVASEARWHAARVSLAAETANAYLQLRYQEHRLAQAEADAASRAASARLTRALATAGFSAPAELALASASAAEGAASLVEQKAERERQIKALVALSGLPEPGLREALATAPGHFPQPAPFAIAALPAQLLLQRPDVAAAERELAAVSAAIGSAEAARYPRLSLAGSITPQRLNTDGQRLSATTWSIGPSLSLPLFDGGRNAARVEAAEAAYDAAAAAYRQTAREAVSEVEQALVRLDSVEARQESVAQAAAAYHTAFLATAAGQRAGFATLIELEVSRRSLLSAEASLAAWQQERIAAWVALYRAVGGAWLTEPPAGEIR